MLHHDDQMLAAMEVDESDVVGCRLSATVVRFVFHYLEEITILITFRVLLRYHGS